MDRPGFKPGGWRHALPGGFDSHSPPPLFEGVMIIRGLEFPDDLHYLVEHDVWVRLDADGLATVGITALGIKLSGEIYMCRAKPVGTAVEQGRAIGVVELAKAIVSVKCAVGGTVVAVNPRLEAAPELVHLDPYDGGWIARLSLRDFVADQAQLVHGEPLRAAMQGHAWPSEGESA